MNEQKTLIKKAALALDALEILFNKVNVDLNIEAEYEDGEKLSFNGIEALTLITYQYAKLTNNIEEDIDDDSDVTIS